MGFKKGSVRSQAQTGKPYITEWRGEESAAPSLAARSLRSLCGPSRAHRRQRGQRGACLCWERGGRAGRGLGASRAEPRRDRVGLGAGRITPRPRTEGNTENEIALAS